LIFFSLLMHAFFIVGFTLIVGSIIRIILNTYYVDSPRNTGRYKLLVGILLVTIVLMVLISLIEALFFA